MAHGMQERTPPRPRITRPRSEWSVRAERPNGDSAHPTGNWRAQITVSARNDRKRTIAQQTTALQERIRQWLRQEQLDAEVARIDPLDGRIAVLVTCSSRCKHLLRTAFPDLETTSGAIRVAHLT